MNKKILITILILSIVIISACGRAAKIGSLGSQHIHADVKVYVDNAYIDFSQPQYQLRAKFVHFEDGRGDVVHVHATGVTINHMLDTLKMSVDKDCLKLNNGKKYCNNADKTVKFYVNDLSNEEFGDYVIKDLDRILVSYGLDNEEQIQKQLNSVTKNSVIFSKGAA